MKAGDVAPEFTAPDETGRSVRLPDLLTQGPVVLFFYPGAMTPVCTKESCHFRDLAGEFTAAGAQVVGISADPVAKQAQFAAMHTLGFPLLSDPDRRIAAAYGVRRPGRLPSKRATFVIGADGRIRQVVTGELSAHKHADAALAALRS